MYTVKEVAALIGILLVTLLFLALPVSVAVQWFN